MSQPAKTNIEPADSADDQADPFMLQLAGYGQRAFRASLVARILDMLKGNAGSITLDRREAYSLLWTLAGADAAVATATAPDKPLDLRTTPPPTGKLTGPFGRPIPDPEGPT